MKIKKIKETKKMFGDEHVVVFDKLKAAEKFDVMDNFEGRNVIVYARNVCNEIARNLGLKYFAEFEDDYTAFQFKRPEGAKLAGYTILNFDDVCEAMIEFVEDASNANEKFRAVAFAQGGDYIGGTENELFESKIKRKAMNSMFFKVPEDAKDDVMYIGRMNDDVNLYTTDGQRGGLWFQIALICLVQKITQSQEGGNATAYKKFGTYVKSFYSVITSPSCVKVAMLNSKFSRIHHSVKWNNCAPKILNEKYKK